MPEDIKMLHGKRKTLFLADLQEKGDNLELMYIRGL